ncbi:MAG: YfhO family protein [Clostridiales bacterium]|nr:YfhO family protein [Clostridiales bacterium]
MNEDIKKECDITENKASAAGAVQSVSHGRAISYKNYFKSDENESIYLQKEKLSSRILCGIKSTPRNIRRFFYGKKYLGFCFLAPFVLMALIYVAMGVWPVSNNSALVLDLNAQYVYFLEKFRSIIAEGGSFLYSFERALGGEFMGIFAYYIASPFNLITLLFPKEFMTEALLLILLLKCGASGFTFGIFLHGTRGERRPTATLIFSTMYALSAFAVVMQHNLMWTDNIICLPLIMLGIDRIIKYRKAGTYTLFLAAAVLSNFYIGYMTCIFVAVYFFVRFFSLTREERNPLHIKAHFIRTLGRIGIFSLVAVMISAVVVFTAYYSLSFGKLEFSEPNFAPSQLYNFTDILSKIYFGSYDSVRPEGMPFLYCGMMMPLLAPLYFITPGIAPRKKIGAGVLMLFFTVSFNLTTADLIWHGFQKPNWLNARFTFIFVMVALIMAYEVFIRISRLGYGKVVACGAVLVLILFILQALEVENLPTFRAVWASVGIIGLYLAIMRFTHAGASSKGLSISAIALVIIMCGEMFAAGVVNLYALDEDVVFSSRDSYRDFLDPYIEAISENTDDGFYRAEKLKHRKPNDNFALGLRGLSNSTSTLNASVIDLLESFGFTSKSHWSKYVGGTLPSDSFFGIKYLYVDSVNDKLPQYISDFYKKIGETDAGIETYENPYALSVAFAASSLISDIDISEEEYDTPFDVMNAVYGAICGDFGIKVWEKQKIEETLHSDCTVLNVQDNHTGYEKSGENSSPSMTYRVKPNTDSPIYMYIPSKWPRKATLSVDGMGYGNYFTNDSHAIIELGSHEKNKTFSVSFAQQEDKMYMKNCDSYFYTFNSDAMDSIAEQLADSQFEITYHSENRLEGNISVADEESVFMTTIPYDEGWNITCDGEPVEYDKTLGSLISFPVSKGTHEIKMNYCSEAFKTGISLTCVGMGTFAALTACEFVWRRYLRAACVRKIKCLRSKRGVRAK